MFEELAETNIKYKNMEESLYNPQIVSDTAKYTALLKEMKEMEEVVTSYRLYLSLENELENARELAREEEDEMRALALSECKELESKLEAQTEHLQMLLLPHDPNDEKNVIMEIRAGAGGEEAALFVSDLYRMYSMFAVNQGYRLSVISDTPTELGGHRQMAFSVEGQGAYSRLKFESGVHRVQRVPETESQGRIQTSTVTVAVLPEVEDVNIEINPSDVMMEACRSSGAGGQHINKTDSAVRLTHKPTGIVVECQEERSQYKNRDKAMKMLKSILYDREQQAQDNAIADERRKQVGTGDRSEKIRTYNFPQSRVTDHRIGLSLFSIDKFMNGAIDEMLDALSTAETAQKMAKEKQ